MDDNSDSTLTQQDLQALDVVLERRKLKEKGEFWETFRRRAAYALLAAVPLGGGGGVAYSKLAPDSINPSDVQRTVTDETAKAKRERTLNKLQIDNLGEEVVLIQDAQAVMPDYIIEAVRAPNAEALALVKENKPEALKKIDATKAKKKRDAKKGKLLEVTSAELEQAMRDAEGDKG